MTKIIIPNKNIAHNSFDRRIFNNYLCCVNSDHRTIASIEHKKGIKSLYLTSEFGENVCKIVFFLEKMFMDLTNECDNIFQPNSILAAQTAK